MAETSAAATLEVATDEAYVEEMAVERARAANARAAAGVLVVVVVVAVAEAVAVEVAPRVLSSFAGKASVLEPIILIFGVFFTFTGVSVCDPDSSATFIPFVLL